MGQIKVYGLKENLNSIKSKMSDVIHSCVVEAFQFPKDKRFHRFFPLGKEDFYFPEGRISEKYTVIEISIFEGRSIDAKKNLVKLLLKELKRN